jgi:hypothetical protein
MSELNIKRLVRLLPSSRAQHGASMEKGQTGDWNSSCTHDSSAFAGLTGVRSRGQLMEHGLGSFVPRIFHSQGVRHGVSVSGSRPQVKHRTASKNSPSPPHASGSAGANLRFDAFLAFP